MIDTRETLVVLVTVTLIVLIVLLVYVRLKEREWQRMHEKDSHRYISKEDILRMYGVEVEHGQDS